MAPAAQELFRGHPESLRIYEAIVAAIAVIGPAETRVSKSQIAFRRRKGFAFVWRPGQYVKSEVPAVVSFSLPKQLHDARIKEAVRPSPGVWMHHVELRNVSEVDDQLRAWLASAYENAA